MVTVSLTTDWGHSGLYSGLFKAKLVQRMPGVQIVDVSHDIKPYSVEEAVFALRNCYKFFGTNTIHIISVASQNISDQSKNREFICFQYNYQYFIGPNNGLWTLLLGENAPQAVYKLVSSYNRPSIGSFEESDLFVDAVNALSLGKPPEKIGQKVPCVAGRNIGLPKVSPDTIIGNFLYFDNYGNGITNISEKDFKEVGKDRTYEIIVGSHKNKTYALTNDYSLAKGAQIMAYFNCSGFLEIAIPYNSLQDMILIDKNTRVLVTFYDYGNEPDRLQLQ